VNLTLYHGEPNGPSLTVLAALFETGCVAELKPVNLARGERHRPGVPRSILVDMSVEGEGPVLVADGEPMADSVFIACFLDDVGAGARLQPKDPYRRWEMMSWCRWVIERVAPAAAFLGTRAHLAKPLAAMDQKSFDQIIASIGSADLAGRWRDIRAGAFPDDKRIDSEAKIKAAVEKVEATLEGRDFLIDGFTIADLETYAQLAGMAGVVPDAFAGKPRAAAWLARVAARPSVVKALSLAKTGDPRTAWAPGPEINRWG
jgi:GST-like protein